MKTITMSVSRLLKYLNCPREYWYYYERRLRPIAKSATLVFGTVMHGVIEGYLRGQLRDPGKAFVERWDEAVSSQALSYSSVWSEEKLRDCGMHLADAFPEAWERTGFQPLPGPDGEPLLEARLEAPLAPGLKLVGVPDFIGIDAEGRIAVVDFKTPSSPSDEVFLELSDQLGAYQLLIEACGRELGIDRIERLGHMELIKRSVKKAPRGNQKNPEVAHPTMVGRRSPDAIAELRDKLRWAAEDIRRGRFARNPRMAFNSPCTLCDYRLACAYGEMSDLKQDPAAREQAA